FYPPRALRAPHSFPTRRSSDLLIECFPNNDMLLTSRTDEPCFAGFVAILAVFVSLMTFPSFTPTKRDNQSSGMVLSADLAIAAKDRKSTRLNSSHVSISYAVFC